MKQVKRIACGAGDCIFNKHFRCTKELITVDDTSKCLDYKMEDK